MLGSGFCLAFLIAFVLGSGLGFAFLIAFVLGSGGFVLTFVAFVFRFGKFGLYTDFFKAGNDVFGVGLIGVVFYHYLFLLQIDLYALYSFAQRSHIVLDALYAVLATDAGIERLLYIVFLSGLCAHASRAHKHGNGNE